MSWFLKQWRGFAKVLSRVWVHGMTDLAENCFERIQWRQLWRFGGYDFRPEFMVPAQYIAIGRKKRT